MSDINEIKPLNVLKYVVVNNLNKNNIAIMVRGLVQKTNRTAIAFSVFHFRSVLISNGVVLCILRI